MIRKIVIAALTIASFSACQPNEESDTDPKSGTGDVVAVDPVAATVSAYCERLDECNYLAAGTSVAECTAEIEEAFDELTPAEGRDLAKGIDVCLDFETCSAFARCIYGSQGS